MDPSSSAPNSSGATGAPQAPPPSMSPPTRDYSALPSVNVAQQQTSIYSAYQDHYGGLGRSRDHHHVHYKAKNDPYSEQYQDKSMPIDIRDAPGSMMEDRYVMPKRDSTYGHKRDMSVPSSASYDAYSQSREPSSELVEDRDYHQQGQVPILKAQLKLVTQERDMLKKDVKRFALERHSFNAGPTINEMQMHHHRAGSDTSSAPHKQGLPSNPNTLSRSHSIASSSSPGDNKNLQLSPIRHPHFENVDTLSPVSQADVIKKHQSETLKRLDQAMHDADFYHREFEAARARLNEAALDKQRLEQEISSLRLYVEEEQKEIADLRRQQQEMLNSESGPGDSLSLMYGTLLRNYEVVKDDYTLIRRRYDELVGSHSSAVSKLEQSQEDINHYKKMYQDILTERNQYKQQWAQVLRQCEQAVRERNDFKEALTKVQSQHEEARKELNQAMTVRIKASKDLKRLTEERNAAMQEYTLIMSERDSVHKEIEKLQEEVNLNNKKMTTMEEKSKTQDEERRKLVCQVETLKREIEQSLYDRDKAIKEAHELREKIGGGKMTTNTGDSGKGNTRSRIDVEKYRKDRESLGLSGSQSNLDNKGLQKEKVENLEQANDEIERLRKINEKLTGELQDASLEVDVAKNRRDWAFSERDKVVLERESIRTLCDKLRRERDRAVSELAEALRDSDEVKKKMNETTKENKELRERVESFEKEVRLKAFQKIPGSHCHSHDSAIDSDLQEWETENIDIDMNGLSSVEDLGIDLAGGRDDLNCPSGDKPIYVSSIGKGSLLSGKLKVNDCILKVNNLDCRDIERSTVINTLKNANSAVSVVVRRRKVGRKHQAILHLSGSSHGLILNLGVYVGRIQSGSIAAKEGSIAVGDRILSINDVSVDHVDSLSEALKPLSSGTDPITLVLAKSSNPSSIGLLSSSSSGQNMHVLEEDKTQQQTSQQGPLSSPKTISQTTSPIKETLRGSHEYMKKFLSGSTSSQKHLGGGIASSSCEKMFSNNRPSSNHSGSKSSLGLMETVREKLDSVRSRRKSKEPMNESRESVSSRDANELEKFSKVSKDLKGSTDMAIATLDSVLAEYPNTDVQPLGMKGSPSSTKQSKDHKPGKKRRSKDSKGNGAKITYTGGGTWPRTRTGQVIEQTTGTVMHPNKMKKERLPLTELLNNIPKYPPEKKEISDEDADGKTKNSEANEKLSRRNAKRPLTAYEIVEPDEPEFQKNNRRITSPSLQDDTYPHEPLVARGPSSNNPYGRYKPLVQGPGLPIDIYPDNSVKSANAEKEVLERYLRKSHTLKSQSRASPITSPSMLSVSPTMVSSASSPVYASNFTSAQTVKAQRPDQAFYKSGVMHPSSISYNRHANEHMIHPIRAPTGSFNAFYNVGGAQFPNSSSSPRYSSPPPLVSALSGDSLLSSPIPDFRVDTNKFYHYEHNPSVAHGLPHHNSPAPHETLPHSASGVTPAYGYSNFRYRGSRTHANSHQVGLPQQPHYGGYNVAQPQSHQGGTSLQTQISHYSSTSSPPLYGDHYGQGGYQKHYTKESMDPYPPRVRIPSNNSLGSSTSKISSSSSIDRPINSGGHGTNLHHFQHQHMSKSESPLHQLPSYRVQYLLSDGRAIQENQPSRKPQIGEIRQIDIEKSSEQLGITIDNGMNNKGVFVSSVSENSLANLVGLQVGDQLLEVCGINLRNCGKDKAAIILQQVRNSITMKVQFNPIEYDGGGEETDDSDEDDQAERHPSVRMSRITHSGRGGGSPSGSPTPKNSPKSHRGGNNFMLVHHPQQPHQNISSLPPSTQSTLTKHHVQQIVSTLQASPPRAPASPPYEARLVFPKMIKSGDLGVRLVGGNKVGIFVHSVDIDSPAYKVGLRCADQILEYNNVDLRQATAEQAAYELAKPAENVSILVQYNPDKYNIVKDQPGDAYYVRAMFDRHRVDHVDPPQLAFSKDDILFIDNTMYNGVPGHWSAWLVDQDGKRREWGVVPSKYKVEEELLLKRSGDLESDQGSHSRRTWQNARSSFFKRKRKPGSSSGHISSLSSFSRSSSRESKELASFSDMASLSYSDSGGLHEDIQIHSYIRVERLDYLVTRPVLIVGPLADAVMDKLVSDFPHKFARCEPKFLNLSQEELDRLMMENNIIDYKRRGSHFECTTVDTVREICERNQHCILNIHLDFVERLHHNQIYPIVLLIKFKTVKQIKEVKIPTSTTEMRLSQKDAKNIFEHTQKLETEYKHLISNTIHAGANLMLMCTQIASTIDEEQNKTLWVPSGTIW